LFKLSNAGDGTAKNVRYFYKTITADTRTEHVSHAVWSSEYIQVGDMPANAFLFVEVVCKPQAHFVCYMNGTSAFSDGSDKNPNNHDAQDYG
jgi:hypothetical protein